MDAIGALAGGMVVTLSGVPECKARKGLFVPRTLGLAIALALALVTFALSFAFVILAFAFAFVFAFALACALALGGLCGIKSQSLVHTPVDEMLESAWSI
jgi:hypothetical protein